MNNGMHIYDIKVDVHKAALEIKEIGILFLNLCEKTKPKYKWV